MATKSRTAQRAGIATVDPIWEELRREAEEAVRNEPALGGFIYATILSKDRLEDAVCHRLAQRLNHSDVDAGLIAETFTQVLADRPELGRAFRADLAAVYDRDPACSRYIEPLLYFKGFHALVTHRFAHELLQAGPARLRALPAEPELAHLRRRHQSRGQDRHRHHARPRHRHRHRRDGGDRRQLLAPAGRDARRHRQGDGRPPSQDRRQRLDQRRRQGAGQHQGRQLQPHRRRQRGAEGRAAGDDGGGRAGQGDGARRLPRARAHHGSAAAARRLRLRQA